MKNFKKILASVGMLGVAVPAALGVVACGQEATFNLTEATQKALANALNNYEDDMENGIPVKGLTYNQFFHKNDSDEDAKNFNFLQTFLYSKVEEALEVGNVDAKEIEAQMKEVRDWSVSAITLVYADLENYAAPEADQAVITTINSAIGEDEKEKTIETLFTDAVQAEYKHDDIKDPAFWEMHNKATLAIKVNANVGGIKLADTVKTLLTFTFAK